MKISWPLSRAASMLALLVYCAASSCPAQYTFTTIDYPGAAETIVLGINNVGGIVGQYGDIDFTGPSQAGNRGFVFDGQSFQTVHVPDARSTSARGINDEGVIVGGYALPGGQTHGFVLDGSTYDDIVTPFAQGASVTDINNQGQIVGTYTDDNFVLDVHGFYFDGADFTSIDIPDANTTHMVGITDTGDLVGFFATAQTNEGFMLSESRTIPIKATSVTQVVGVNNEGQVVGFFLAGRSFSEAWYQSFLFDTVSQTFIDANVDLPGPDCTFSLVEPVSQCIRIVTGINSDGTIVGYYDNDDGVFHGFVGTRSDPPMLQAGDADQDLKFDQLDLVQVLVAGRYLTGERATWGEGDWDRAPGGSPGNPPPGDGVFDQFDVIAAASPGHYRTGNYATVVRDGQRGDGQTSILYDANTGELAVDAPAGIELTSIHIESAAGIFTGQAAKNLGGSFDNDGDNNIFKATFGSSFGSLSFGNLAQAGLAEETLLGDLTVVGSLASGGGLGDVDLIYIPVPEPSPLVLGSIAVVLLLQLRSTSSSRSA